MPTIKILQKRYHSQINELDFSILLAHAINKPREFLYAHPNFPLSAFAYARLRYFLFHYKRGYSVAAITHHKEFYGLNFYVNKDTLIPRPETELLVEEAIAAIKTPPSRGGSGGCWLIDVGTGSGCIPITIATHLNCHPERSEGSLSQSGADRDSSIAKLPQNDSLKIFATDISKSALRVARKNARIQNVSINFLHGNLLEPFVKQINTATHQHRNTLTIEQLNNQTIIITANLPYLTPIQFEAEPSIQREPRSALVAENSGLALYEKLLQQISHLSPSVISTTRSLRSVQAPEESLAQSAKRTEIPLRGIARPRRPRDLTRNDKLKMIIFFEIDPSQTQKISSLVKTYLPLASIEIKTDLAGRDRVVKINLTLP
ncbi:MAG: peptide chain release factor N(5)-glutamine methyltransferase [Candidatus Magasanikbacteria bacterium]|nr:peptide chain release factor N(5)-glutamine methyltransferase [Candidatus Magasanikbacteria bacterium]